MSILNFVTFNTVNKQSSVGSSTLLKVERYPQSKTLRTADLADSHHPMVKFTPHNLKNKLSPNSTWSVHGQKTHRTSGQTLRERECHAPAGSASQKVFPSPHSACPPTSIPAATEPKAPPPPHFPQSGRE